MIGNLEWRETSSAETWRNHLMAALTQYSTLIILCDRWKKRNIIFLFLCHLIEERKGFNLIQNSVTILVSSPFRLFFWTFSLLLSISINTSRWERGYASLTTLFTWERGIMSDQSHYNVWSVTNSTKQNIRRTNESLNSDVTADNVLLNFHQIVFSHYHSPAEWSNSSSNQLLTSEWTMKMFINSTLLHFKRKSISSLNDLLLCLSLSSKWRRGNAEKYIVYVCSCKEKM